MLQLSKTTAKSLFIVATVALLGISALLLWPHIPRKVSFHDIQTDAPLANLPVRIIWNPPCFVSGCDLPHVIYTGTTTADGSIWLPSRHAHRLHERIKGYDGEPYEYTIRTDGRYVQQPLFPMLGDHLIVPPKPEGKSGIYYLQLLPKQYWPTEGQEF